MIAKVRRVLPKPGGSGQQSTILSQSHRAGRRRRARRRTVLCAAVLWSAAAVDAAEWSPLGPAPIANGPWTGRVSAVACSPTDPDRYFVAGANGGVWRTTDGGSTWTPQTDHLPRAAIGALALDPSNESVIYAGSGEANFAQHSRYGAGLYKSSDGGDTWEVLAAPTFAGRCFSRIVVHPVTPSVIYAAITPAGGFPARVAARGHPLSGGAIGVFRSSDGGFHWQRLAGGLPLAAATDLVIDPLEPGTLYAAIGHIFGHSGNGVYKSVNGGATWTKLEGGLPVGNVGRISLALAPSMPQRLYALISTAANSTGGGAFTLNVYRSDDAGATWQPTDPGPFQATYGWYLSVAAVQPDDPDTVFMGGLVLLRSQNGGADWHDVTPPHVDQHALAFDAAGRLLAGDDGGVHRSDDLGDSWEALNHGLGLIQFYAGLSLAAGDFLLGGTQDNGTVARGADGAWIQRLSNDGGWTSHHPAAPQRFFCEFQGTANLYRSINGGINFAPVGSGISQSDRNCFLPPHVIDPGNPQRILHGTHRIWESLAAGGSWSAISGDLTGGGSAAIRSLAIAPSNGQTMYAATNDGRVLVSTDGGKNWELRRENMPGWPRVTREIAVDPEDDDTACLAVAWYGGERVLCTSDYGQTWDAVPGNLPDIPVVTVAFERRHGLRHLYIGTDAGVYRSINGGAFWGLFGSRLPNVPVVDLLVDPAGGRLIAATEGRGAWSIALPRLGDADHNGRVDVLDYAALQECMGPPGRAGAPASCLDAFDFDGDASIDAADYGYFFAAHTHPSGQ